MMQRSPHPSSSAALSAPGVTPPALPVSSDDGEYAHLIPQQRRYAQLDPAAPERPWLRDQLVSGYLPVAHHIARRFAGRGEPLEDLIQVATLGLINAVDRFEPSRGSNFLSFAVPTITGEVRRYFRDHTWATRVPRRLKDLYITIKATLPELSQQLGRPPRPSDIADRLGLPAAEVIEALQAGEAYRSLSLDEKFGVGDDDSGPGTAALSDFLGNLDGDLTLIEDRQALRPLLADLAPRERTILALRFFRHLTQAQIAERVGISQMHVSRVLRRTLTVLREGMNRTE